MALEVYGPYVLYENGCKVLYIQVFGSLYGVLVESFLWCKKVGLILKNKGLILFEVNKKHTVRFRVDDMRSIHVGGKVNDIFDEWLKNAWWICLSKICLWKIT